MSLEISGSAITSDLSELAGDVLAGAVTEGVSARVGRGARVLVLVPDHTRTAPVGEVFAAVHGALSERVSALDVMVALGTHPPMSEEAIMRRLGMTAAERAARYRDVRFFNHAWDDAARLREIGTIGAEEIEELSGGRFAMDVVVRVNAALFDYDHLVIIGPVFPHEVVGFSGGNKYLFPGVSGPEILNFFHWLGAVVTNARTIGNARTPVRRVVDRAASMVDLEKTAVSLVVKGAGACAVFVGKPERSWEEAAAVSARAHIVRKPHPFHTIVSCAPAMYDELWVGGKCMYKLEPVLADGGELIIFAPHLKEVSAVHGRLIREIGYHCADYFLKQWDRFSAYPWGVLAHSTHVRGGGVFECGVERCRARVTLATGIAEEVCREIGLGYRDPASVRLEDFAGREDEGILMVPRAGEMLYQLAEPAEWARPV